jgi:two-component system sensor histidine kinase/response regulator
LAILGHDLISPFNVLLGMSDVLVRNIKTMDSDKIQKFALNINKSAINTYKLLEDILLWARSQQGSLPFEPQKLQLDEVCRETIEVLILNANAKNIRIDYPKTAQIGIFADINMIRTVLRNLISNAVKFTHPNGLVSISAEQNSSGITITVEDNGIGISPENLAKLFDISQVLTTKGTAREEGTGLGLLLCKDFVEKHGGIIWVESNPGKGSRFLFTLPVVA